LADGRESVDGKGMDKNVVKELASKLADLFLSEPSKAKKLAKHFGLLDALQATLGALLVIAHARVDPNVFIEYTQLTPKNTYIQQTWFQKEWQSDLSQEGNTLIAAPRGHGKSVQVSARCVFELGHNHNLRIKVVSSIDDAAEDILSLIHDNIERNERVHQVFPDLTLDYAAGVTKDSITVSRTIIQRDASVQAKGVLSAAAGGRADILVLDDAVDYVNAVKNPAMRPKVIDSIRRIWVPLMSDVGRMWWLCTPYHVEDATHVFRRDGMFDREWWKPAITYHLVYDENGETITDPETGEPKCRKEILWPEWWTSEKLERKRREIGTVAFTQQYLLKVMSDEDLTFPIDVLRPSFDSTLWRIGQAVGLDDENGLIPAHWPTYGGIDLASAVGIKAAYCVIWTIAKSPENGRLYLKEMIRKRMKMPELMPAIQSAFDRNHWQYAYVENNAFQKAVEDTLDDSYKHIPIKGCHTGSNKNDAKVGLPGMATAFSKGLFVIPARYVKDLTEADQSPFGIFWNELTTHPGGRFSDTIMALWFAYRAAIEGGSADIYDSMAEAASVA